MIHFTSKCKSKNTCFKEGCSAKHHTTLHDYFLNPQRKKEKVSRLIPVKQSKVSERVFLKIEPVKIMKNDGQTISTFVFLDNGSQSTLIIEDYSKQLKLKGYSRIKT